MSFWTGKDPILEIVEKATTETNTQDDWGIIMEICDKAGKTSDDAKNVLRAIFKRLQNQDPHVALKAITLLDACVKNSGKTFHIEVASREFEDNFNKLMTKSHQKISKNLRLSLKKWAENEFKNDPQLTLIPSLYSKLKSSGLDFSTDDMPVRKTAAVNKDPNIVESQEEEEQIMKAIELSLKETSGSPRNSATAAAAPTVTTSSSLYPSTSLVTANAPTHTTPAKELKKVRALYDFEAAEDNELTFTAGEIIFLIDDSDKNWWKGSNQRGEGLFPSNFVTDDLSIEPEKFLFEKAKKIVQFKETVEVKIEKEPEEVEINEGKIDRLLHLLHEADPTNPETDTEEMLKLESEVNSMGPLIDSELERVDRKHAQLTQLSSDLVEALGLYHNLMREPQIPTLQKLPPFPYPPNSMPMSSSMTFNGTLPQHPTMNMGQVMPGTSGIPTSHDRIMYMPQQQGGPPPQQGMQQQFPPMSGMMTTGRMGHLPPGMPPMQQGINPNMPHMPSLPQIPDENRRRDPNAGPYHGVPNYGPGSLPNFHIGPMVSHSGPPQEAHYATSTPHMM